MCGLAGVMIGAKRRSRRELDALGETFTRLLLLSEHRGPHATGVALVRRDGTCQVIKHPLSARHFVGTTEYALLLDAVDDQVTLLMGHTRWPTRGTVHDPANNHPLVASLPQDTFAPAPAVLLTHNGVVDQPDQLAARWGLPRQAAVDSEILLQLAVRASGPTGVDVPAYLAWLAQVPGRMALAVCDTRQPHRVLLIRGTMPLALAWQRRRRLLAYASDEMILQRALGGEAGWSPVSFPAGQACLVDTQDSTTLSWHDWLSQV